MSSETMCYVACDPTQPGAAWGVTTDKPEWAEETAVTVKDWQARGADVRRMTLAEAHVMLKKWVHPGTPVKQPNPPATPDPQAQ